MVSLEKVTENVEDPPEATEITEENPEMSKEIENNTPEMLKETPEDCLQQAPEARVPEAHVPELTQTDTPPVKKRGRPKKEAAPPQQPKKRGRPPKAPAAPVPPPASPPPATPAAKPETPPLDYLLRALMDHKISANNRKEERWRSLVKF